MKNKTYFLNTIETAKIKQCLKKTLENIKNNNNQKNIQIKSKSHHKNKFKINKKNKNDIIQKIFTQGKFELKTFEESKLQFEKLKLRSKFIKLYSKVLIKDPEEFLSYNFLFKNNIMKFGNKKKQKKKKDEKLIITPHSNLFSDIQTTFRYEDIYNTPREFIQKNFSREEKNFLVLDPKYFFLNKPPFSNANLPLKYTLKEKMDEEEEIFHEKIKKKKLYLMKNRTLSLNNKINNNKKIKKNFLLKSESFENNISKIPLTNRTEYNTIEKINSLKHNDKNYLKKEINLKSKNINNKNNFIKSRNIFNLNRPNTARSYNKHTNIITETNFTNKNYDNLYYNTEENTHNKELEYIEKKKAFLFEKNYLFNLKKEIFTKKKDENVKELKKKEENKKKLLNLLKILQNNYLSNKY